MPVGSVAGHKEQKYPGKKLRQPYQAKIEGPPSDLIHLPAHRDRLHFKRGNDEKSRHLVKRKVWIRKPPGPFKKSFAFPHVLSTVPQTIKRDERQAPLSARPVTGITSDQDHRRRSASPLCWAASLPVIAERLLHGYLSSHHHGTRLKHRPGAKNHECNGGRRPHTLR